MELTLGMPVSAPALWGKLPSHADYVQHRAKAHEVQAWQRWLDEEIPASTPKRALVDENWVALDLPSRPSGRYGIPIAFVLPPGTLSFSPRQHVFGVMMPSRDRLGREHPLLIYQYASARWLRTLFDEPAQTGNVLQRWPFALARLFAHYAPETATALAWPSLLPELMDRLWLLFAPGLMQRLGIGHQTPSLSSVLKVFAELPVIQQDASEILRGMDALPWSDWPRRLWTQPAQPAFWRQDSQGGYIDASRRLKELWKWH